MLLCCSMHCVNESNLLFLIKHQKTLNRNIINTFPLHSTQISRVLTTLTIITKLLKKLKLSGGFWAEHMHILCVCTYRRLKRQDYKKKGALCWAGSYSETWRSVSHWKLWLEVTHWNFHLLLQDDISCVLITFFLTGEAICVSIPNILHLDNPREHFTNWLPINYWVTRGINTANSEMRN